MKAALRLTISGAAGGGVIALAALGLIRGFGLPAGGALSVLAGAVTGAAAAWLAALGVARQAAARIETLLAGRAEAIGGDATGWAQLDLQLGTLEQTLARLRLVQGEFDEIEGLARALWHALLEAGPNAEPAADPRRSVLGLLAEVRNHAGRVCDDSRALEQATDQIATGAWDQSETVVRTTTTVEGLSDKIDQISHNADAAAEAGQRTRAEARRGLEQVHELIEGIDRLRAHVESNGHKVRRLGDRSVEIGAIVDLIDGISGRTDMLALNATIESVRAGEHGRGFAVVAEEIRKLAERSAAATREIGALVEAIQADTHESIAALGEEQAEVEQEAQRVREAGAALERIGEVAERSAQLVEGISRSANDQVHSTHELVRAMQRMSEVTQQTQSGAARLREHVKLLAGRCERLHRLALAEATPAGAAPGRPAARPAAPAAAAPAVLSLHPRGNGQARRAVPIEQAT